MTNRLAHATFAGHGLLSCRACGGLLIEMPIFVPVVDAARALETRTGIVTPRQQQPGDMNPVNPVNPVNSVNPVNPVNP